MKLLQYFLFLVATTSAFGSEQWLCTEDSTQVRGSEILACGVGEGTIEMDARVRALRNAQQEFQSVKQDFQYIARPSRSTCEEKNGVWKCYRLVKYEITGKKEVLQKLVSLERDEDYSQEDENLQQLHNLLNKTIRRINEVFY